MTTDEAIEKLSRLEVFPDHMDYFEDEESLELEKVVRLLRAESSNAYLCGRGSESNLIDKIVERLEAHEHRR